MKDYTTETIRKIVESRGGRIVKGRYVNWNGRLTIHCEEGHEWSPMAGQILVGQWCPDCAPTARLKLKDVQEYCKSRGGRCLSNKLVNGRMHVRVVCSEGHPWTPPAATMLRNKSWCPRCAGVGKRSIGDVKKIVDYKGGRIVSGTYVNGRSPFVIDCGKGHLPWKTTPHQLFTGSWCRRCAGKQRYTIDEVRKDAATKNIDVLDTIYSTSRTRMHFQCTICQHKWLTTWSAVRNRTGCPSCATERKRARARSRRLGIGVFKKIAQDLGGECLSNAEDYKDKKSKLRFKCASDHTWTTAADNVRIGAWCPDCGLLRHVRQRICRAWFEYFFNKSFPTVSPSWLPTGRGRNFQLDGYNNELNLAFEYQGVQHYKKIPYLHQKRSFKQLQADDKKKEILCKRKGVALIHVPFTVRVPDMGKFIAAECLKRGYKILPGMEDKPWTELNVVSPMNKLDEVRRYVESKGGHLAKNATYVDNRTPLEVICARGHTFHPRPHTLLCRHSWCSECARIERKEKNKV